MKEIKQWNHLSPGDLVDVIAPASYSTTLRMDHGIEWLRSVGLRPHAPKEMIKRDVFFAAPLELQLKHLKHALYSDSKAIWCLRGGYGSMRLIPELMKWKKPKSPKLFIGFSDITALHLFFNQQWNWPTIHGRTLAQMNLELAKSPDRKFLTNMIFGRAEEKVFKNLKPLNLAAQKKNIISAPIVGGNLRILQSSLGTSWELKAKKKILFIEDVSERGYSIDRMFEQMIQAKIIDSGPEAIIFGDFADGKESDGKDHTNEALKRFAQKVPYPVLKGLPCGHGEKYNYPLPFNVKAKLILGEHAELSCRYGGVSEAVSRE